MTASSRSHARKPEAAPRPPPRHVIKFKSHARRDHHSSTVLCGDEQGLRVGEWHKPSGETSERSPDDGRREEAGGGGRGDRAGRTPKPRAPSMPPSLADSPGGSRVDTNQRTPAPTGLRGQGQPGQPWQGAELERSRGPVQTQHEDSDEDGAAPRRTTGQRNETERPETSPPTSGRHGPDLQRKERAFQQMCRDSWTSP